jgi:hypothetical protein
LTLEVGSACFRLGQVGGGALALAGESQAGRLYDFMLHVKQVRRVMDAQKDFGLAEQGFCLIADHLTNRHRQGAELLLQAVLPSVGITLRLVLLDQEKTRDRFHGHQADVRMKRFVFGHGDLPRRHLRGQPLVFFLREAAQQGFHLLGHGLLSTVGRSDEFIQATEYEKPTQVMEAAVVGLHEYQVRRSKQNVQEGQAVGAFQELHHLRRPAAVLHLRPATAEPIAEGAIGYP